VRRGGIWAGAFRLVAGHPVRVDTVFPAAPAGRDEEAVLRLRSAGIAALTGLRP
jgi:hypothetical protein